MTPEMPEINLTMTSVTVKGESRPLRPNIKVIKVPPIFGIHKTCRKSLGINNNFQYWIWKIRMRKYWKMIGK